MAFISQPTKLTELTKLTQPVFLLILVSSVHAANWTRQGADAGMTKYSPDNIPAAAAPQLAYKKRFYGTWAGYTGNYYYGGNLVIQNGQAVLFSNDVSEGILKTTKFSWSSGQTLAKSSQSFGLGSHAREIDSHHATNPLVWHSDGRIYARRGGDNTDQYAFDPHTGVWTRIRYLPAADTNVWGGDSNTFIQVYGDRFIYRYGDTRGQSSYGAYDISSALFGSKDLGTLRATLGPFVAGDEWRYGDIPKVARGISVTAASVAGAVVLEAVNINDGTKLWQKTYPSDTGGARGFYTSVSDYWRFVATEDGHFVFFSRPSGTSCIVRVLDLNTGAEKWSRTLTNASERPLLAYRAGAVYIVGRAQQFKLNADTGAVIWQASGSFTNDTGYIHRNYESGINNTNDVAYRPMVLTDETIWFVNGSAVGSGILVGLRTSDGGVARTIDLAALVRTGTESFEFVNDLVAADGKLGILINITDSADTNIPKNRFQDLYVYHFSTLGAGNGAPTAANQSVSATEDTPQPVTLSGADPDGNSIFYSIVDSPAHGRLSGVAPNVAYLPDPNWNGTDTFTFRANDGALESPSATVTINMAPVNDAPIAESQAILIARDSPRMLPLTAVDVDNDPISYRIVSPPSHGTLSGTPPNVTYAPAAGYLGADQFTFAARDAVLESPPAAISLDVRLTDLVGHWKFDENTGTYTADASGNNLTGIVSNGPTWIAGKFGSALNFDGVNDYVFVDYAPILNLPDYGGTLSAWIKLNSSNLGQDRWWPIVRKLFHSNSGNRLGVSISGYQGGPTDPIRLRAVFQNDFGGNVDLSGTTSLTAGTWMHVALTYTANQVKVYLNGQLELTGTKTYALTWPNDAGVLIGESTTAGGIDDVRIYPRALSAAEVAALAGAAPPTSTPCDLNTDGSTNVNDVQLCANQAIGAMACSTGDVNRDRACNVIDVQRVVIAALGGQCNAN